MLKNCIVVAPFCQRGPHWPHVCGSGKSRFLPFPTDAPVSYTHLTNGSLSVALRPEKEPATLADLGARVQRAQATIPFVLDGQVLAENLTTCGKDAAWLERTAQANSLLLEEILIPVSYTHLTSISGYAELIETGIAKPADVPEFGRKIRCV